MPHIAAPLPQTSLEANSTLPKQMAGLAHTLGTPRSDHASLLAEAHSLLISRRLPEAWEAFRNAEDTGVEPDLCAGGRWQAAMLLGDYEGGWREADSIRLRGLADPNRFWQGEELAGKCVIVRCLHGYGDAVQFLRYAPLLKATVAHLIVEVPPRFVELARRFDGIDTVVTWDGNSLLHPVEWDVQIEVMELPYIFRTQQSDLPLATKYLQIPAAPGLKVRGPGRLRVGLAWAAGTWNPARALSMDLLGPLRTTEGCEFWNLCEAPPGSLAVQHEVSGLRQHARCGDSIEGLAATIAGLDLIITVDTLAAHLGGALGVKTWVLLPYDGDWRWMHDRDDSPWYPSMRLFRQPSPGNWEDVVASVQRELRALAESGCHMRVSQS